MEYRSLGKSGLKVSALSFGSWLTFGRQVDEQVAYDCMAAAFDAGVNFFDNAEAYAGGESETVMGKIIQKAGWKRSDLVLSTKLIRGGDGPNDRGLSFKHIVEGTDASLARLQTSYVDLIFAHSPDPETPIEETVRAFNHVINTGKAFYWGTSNWNAQMITAAHEVASRLNLIPPLMEQPKYNMLARERVEVEFAPLYRDYGLGTTIYSPLESGLLTGKYNDGMPEGTRVANEDWLRRRFESDEAQESIKKVRQLTETVAEPLRCSMAQLALAWCLKNPNVSTVITGASRPEQVAENMEALEVAEKLTPEWMEKIEGILDNKPA